MTTHPLGVVLLQSTWRLHDNPLLTEARQQCDKVLILLLRPQLWDRMTSYGFPHMSQQRKDWITAHASAFVQAVTSCKGSVIPITHLDHHLATYLEELGVSWVGTESAWYPYEGSFNANLADLFPSCSLYFAHTHSLFHEGQLPFALPRMPFSFSGFRREVEQHCTPLPPLPTLDSLEWSTDHTLPSSYRWDCFTQASSSFRFIPGEQGGLHRLHYYLWETDKVASYKETRNELLGDDYSTKFSPWLATGALSPRTIIKELQDYERKRTANDSTYWVYFELLWREFFLWVAKAFDAHMFLPGGIQQRPLSWTPLTTKEQELLAQWISGTTSSPFVNANMKELAATGFMSNRGRQNVASYLIHDLGLPWLAGAEYFESQLLDFEPGSNYGNWQYIAGVGNDKKPVRKFNIPKQASLYDSNQAFQQYWNGGQHHSPL